MVISIFSPKGGVGKTTLTLALTEVLSKDRKTCVVEFDFSPGDFVSLLRLDPRRNIVKAVQGNIEAALQRPSDRNYDVIVGGMPSDYEKITMEAFNSSIEKLKGMYDCVLLDIQPGFIEPCIDAVNASSKVLLVVEDNLATVARINGFLDWLKINRISTLENFVFVRNKATTSEPMYLSLIRYQLPIVCNIPLFRNFGGIDDKRLLKHVRCLKGAVLGESNRKNKQDKKGFLFWFFRRGA